MSNKNRQPVQHNNQGLSISQQTIYQGMIPQSSEFREYNIILPGAADRILSMAEKQNKHRQNLEIKAINTGIFQSIAGTIIGFILSASCIAASVFLAFNDKETTASIVGGSTVLGLAATFVLGQRSANKKNK